jgi:hypothetical protein
MQERCIRRKWTGSLCPPHALTNIAFYAGQMDEGEPIENFVEENAKHYSHGMIGYGQNVFWTFDGDSWKLGREPCFGDGSQEHFGIFTEMESEYTWLLPMPEDPQATQRDSRYRM